MFPKKKRLNRKAFQREFIKIRPRIAERDNYRCRLCDSPAQDVHHIIFRSQGGTNEESNLICLCRRCHERAHGVESKAIREILQYILKNEGVRL